MDLFTIFVILAAAQMVANIPIVIALLAIVFVSTAEGRD